MNLKRAVSPRSRGVFTGITLLFCLYAAVKADGPEQPEFQSFGPADIGNVVNLANGDLNYRIVVGKVATPQGPDYPLTLHYRSGIREDQEGDWTGLGWHLNVGAITRGVVGFPDDYREEPYVKLSSFYRKTWDDFLNFGIGLAGFGVGIGIHRSPEGTELSGASITLFGVTLSGSQSSASLSFGVCDYASVGLSLSGEGINVSVGSSIVGVSLGMQGNSFSVAGLSSDFFDASYGYSSGGLSVHSITDFSHQYVVFSRTHYTTHAEYERLTDGYAVGYLYQSPYTPSVVELHDPDVAQILTDKTESGWEYATDASNYTYAPRSISKRARLEYVEQNGYALPAKDQYHIQSQGVMGTFEAYKHDAVMVTSAPGSENDGLLGQVSGSETAYTSHWNDQQVGFRQGFADGYAFRMLGERSLNLVDRLEWGNAYPGYADHTNIDGGASPSRVYGTRIEPIFGMDSQFKDKLTGFIVTTEKGMTYYYTLPLFALQNVNWVCKNPDNIDDGNGYSDDQGAYAVMWLLTAITGPDYVRMTTVNSAGVREQLLPHDGDLGYWIAFRYAYGLEVKKQGNATLEQDITGPEIGTVTHPWKSPHPDVGQAWKNLNNGDWGMSYGLREQTYLKSIETASEVAFFRVTPRQDGIGVSMEEYPAGAKTFAIDPEDPTHRVTGIVNGYQSTCEIKRKPAVCRPPTIAPLESAIANLDDCLKIEVVDHGLATSGGLTAYEPLQAIASLRFTCDMTYKSRKGTKTRTGQVGEMQVWVYDPENWSWDESGNIQSRSLGFGTDNWAHREQLAYDDAGLGYQYPCFDKCNIAVGNVLKCINIETDPASGKVVLYVVAVATNSGGVERRSAFVPGQWGFFYDWASWVVTGYSQPQFIGGSINGRTYARYANRNSEVTPYVKRLAEIVWFSKTEYPFLDGHYDPATTWSIPHEWEGQPTPYPYKRVAFEYDYSLGKGSPGSLAPDEGRLTLRGVNFDDEVACRGGGVVDGKQHSFGYRFDYYNGEYTGESDPWGIASMSYDDKVSGTKWNLRRVMSPTGAVQEFNYSRDECTSPLGTICRLGRIYRGDLEPACYGIDNKDDYYLTHAIQSFPDRRTITINASTAGIQPGTYCIIAYHRTVESNKSPKLEEYCYAHGYEVESVSKNTIRLRQDLQLSSIGYTEAEAMFVRADTRAAVGGVRVVHARESAALGYERATEYEYDVTTTLGSLPRDACPPGFFEDVTHKSTGSMTQAGLYYEAEDHGNPWAKDVTTTSTGVKLEKPGAYIVLPHVRNPVPGFYELFWSGNGQYEIKVLGNPQMGYCPVKISMKSGTSINIDRLVVYTSAETDDRMYCRRIDWEPVTGGNPGYYKPVSNALVYPSVTIDQTDNAAGKTRYEFWGWGNRKHITHYSGPEYMVDASFSRPTVNGNEVRLQRMTDRTAIVGQVRRVEYYSNDDLQNPIETQENEYTFADEIPAYAGALKGHTASKATPSEAPGVVVERSVGVDAFGTPQSIIEIKRLPVYLTAVSTRTMNVTRRRGFGFFDCETGGPLLTLTESSSGGRRYDFTMPYGYTLAGDQSGSEAASQRAVLERRNLRTLQTGSVTVDGANVPTPNGLGALTYTQLLAAPIMQATAATYMRLVRTDAAARQVTALALQSKGQWRPRGSTAAFTWPRAGYAWPIQKWTNSATYTEVDEYSRPVEFIDAGNTVHSQEYESLRNAILVKCANCHYGEFIVETFEDEQAGQAITDGRVSPGAGSYVDVWTTRKPASKGLLLAKGTATDPYFATPYTTAGSDAGAVTVRWEFWAAANSGEELSTFTHIQTKENVNDWQGYVRRFSLTRKWRKYAFTAVIPASLAHRGYRVVLRPEHDGESFGERSILYDDIRTYPNDAIVENQWYDDSRTVPVAKCDANLNTRSYEYDGFGRLEAEYNTAGMKVREYERYAMGPNRAPPAPTGLSATVLSSGHVVFAWDPVTDPDGDNVTYSIVGCVWALPPLGICQKRHAIAHGLTESSYEWTPDVAVSCETGCHWQVIADDGRGGSARSSQGTYRR